MELLHFRQALSNRINLNYKGYSATRVCHYSIRTEKIYLNQKKRFVHFHTIILLLSAIAFLFLGGCKNVSFFKKEFISALTYPETDRNVIVYYNTHYRPEGADRLIVTRHKLLRLGKDLKTLPEAFNVYDGSVEKLISFDVRIIHPDGSVKKFGKSDCIKANLSSARIISGLNMYYLPIAEELKIGDLVETVSIHEHTMPFLGIIFSPAEVGDLVYNASCSIEMDLQDSLFCRIENDSISFEIIRTPDSKTYRFQWKAYTAPEANNIFGKKNVAPLLLAQIAKGDANDSTAKQITDWKDFGDVYLKLIRFRLQTESAASLAKKITEGINSRKEKLDAIAEYCQKNIRYEQVYIEKGEFIPNDFSNIISRKYGDCKDYSLAIYLLARSIGINANLALCYRGRGVEFYPEIPVSQFNHMIVFYSENGANYWYDGTNRTGKPGTIDLSLINQTALVLEEGNSRLIPILESTANLLSISGGLQEKDKSLLGNLTFSLKSQYAIEFFYLDFYLNEKDMQTYLYSWLRKNIQENIILKKLTWEVQSDQFIIHAYCELPNAVVSIDPYFYISASRILSSLFPPESTTELEEHRLFYFPYYNRVHVDLEISNLSLLDETTGQVSQELFRLFYQYAIQPGPFSDYERIQFIDEYNAASKMLNTNYKLIRREIL